MAHWNKPHFIPIALGEVLSCLLLAGAGVAAWFGVKGSSFWLSSAWAFTIGRLVVVIVISLDRLMNPSGDTTAGGAVLPTMAVLMLIAVAGFWRAAMTATRAHAPSPDGKA